MKFPLHCVQVVPTVSRAVFPHLIISPFPRASPRSSGGLAPLNRLHQTSTPPLRRLACTIQLRDRIPPSGFNLAKGPNGLLKLLVQAKDRWHELASILFPVFRFPLSEITGCFVPCFFLFNACCGYVIPRPPSSPSSLHMPVINPHLYTSAWSHDHRDDATGKRSQDLRQRAPQATYFLHWNATCREPRLLGDSGHQNQVSTEVPRQRENWLVPRWTNQREKSCIGWRRPRWYRGR